MIDNICRYISILFVFIVFTVIFFYLLSLETGYCIKDVHCGYKEVCVIPAGMDMGQCERSEDVPYAPLE